MKILLKNESGDDSRRCHHPNNPPEYVQPEAFEDGCNDY
jgi:hypothetical protein